MKYRCCTKVDEDDKQEKFLSSPERNSEGVEMLVGVVWICSMMFESSKSNNGDLRGD